MAITLVILRTGLTEKELFLKLVKRGQHANIPYYYSAVDSNWVDGWVIFERLDCAPAPAFRVGVAGDLLIVSKKDLAEITQWFANWGLGLKRLKEETVENPTAALALLSKLREQAPFAKARPTIGDAVAEEIAAFNRATDEGLMTGHNRGRG